jgi:hypothetical protein
VERSVPFYEALFGTAPEKARDGYAKFSLTEPALNFTLNEGARAELGAFNHAGIQVASTDDVLATKDRLVAAGLAAFDEMDTTCCYARQDKIWVHDPDGTPWEVFATHEDSEEAGDGGRALATSASCGCGDSARADGSCCSQVRGCCQTTGAAAVA